MASNACRAEGAQSVCSKLRDHVSSSAVALHCGSTWRLAARIWGKVVEMEDPPQGHAQGQGENLAETGDHQAITRGARGYNIYKGPGQEDGSVTMPEVPSGPSCCMALRRRAFWCGCHAMQRSGCCCRMTKCRSGLQHQLVLRWWASGMPMCLAAAGGGQARPLQAVMVISMAALGAQQRAAWPQLTARGAGRHAHTHS